MKYELQAPSAPVIHIFLFIKKTGGNIIWEFLQNLKDVYTTVKGNIICFDGPLFFPMGYNR